MGKYLLLWEAGNSRIPIDPKERGGGWTALVDLVKQDLEKGPGKDWGVFVGESNGYMVAEGTDVEVANMIQQYVPFFTFKVYPIGSLSYVDEMLKALTG